MAYIDRPTRRERRRNYERNDKNRKERQKIYQSNTWQNLRKARLMGEPLCFVSLCEGKLVPAEEVHHWEWLGDYDNAQDMSNVAYDYDNTVSLTKLNHWRLHHGDLKGCRSRESVIEKLKHLGLFNPPANANLSL